MNERRLLLPFAALFVLNMLAGNHALAASPGLTITASDATMSASGSGSVAWTVTSENGYAGSFSIGCSATNPPADATLPTCGGGALAQVYTVAANGMAEGTIALGSTFCSPSNPSNCPVKLERRRPRFGAGLALAGALMVGLIFRRNARWFALVLATAGVLACMAGLAGCGGSKTLTPGTWQYTVTATADNGSISANTTVNVTVPAGIAVTYY